MRHRPIIILLLLALATSLMVSNVTFAQEKPTAALAPMGALGELDEIEKRIFPVESSFCVSRHVDVVVRVHSHFITTVI